LGIFFALQNEQTYLFPSKMGKSKSNKPDKIENLSKEQLIELLESLPQNPLFNSEQIEEYLNGLIEAKSASETPPPPAHSPFEELQIRLKELLADDINLLFPELKKVMLPNTPKYDYLIMLIARYNRFKEMSQHGLMNFEDAGLEHRTIVQAAMLTINTLKTKFLKDSF